MTNTLTVKSNSVKVRERIGARRPVFRLYIEFDSCAPSFSSDLNPTEMTSEPKLTCTQCGQPEAHFVGDEILCASCCHQRGSCGAVRDASEPTDESGPATG
jgi:hypothetical protein